MAKLNPNERAVLRCLAQAQANSVFEPPYLPFAPIMARTGLDRRVVRLACRSLARKGYAGYSRGLCNDDGLVGAGYGITKRGDALVEETGCEA